MPHLLTLVIATSTTKAVMRRAYIAFQEVVAKSETGKSDSIKVNFRWANNSADLLADILSEYDVNLFDEKDLYDINIIGSMFKAWLRDLPDEILPKETQERIHAACPDQSNAPKMLKDELSMLPPWNYYLLFAITCHLSLLHAYVEKNKMSYNNLLICFAPALRIQGDCFRWLVCDWRNCWQGCWTEKENLEEEYQILDRIDIQTSHSGTTTFGSEERSISSAGSATAVKGFTPVQKQPSAEYLGEELAKNNHPGAGHGRSASQLPELQLLQPISPIFASHSH